MAAKTEHHRKIAERMSAARAQASYPVMSRAEFLAQTPSELRITRKTASKSPKANGKTSSPQTDTGAASSLNFPVVISGMLRYHSAMAKTKSNPNGNARRKEETRMIRDFIGTLVKEGKAKEFLVEHGFVKESGGLTKRYGG